VIEEKHIIRAMLSVQFVAVALLGWYVQSQHELAVRQQGEIQSLNATLKERSRADVFALREKCATQAAESFRAAGYSLNTPAPSHVIYQDHYNAIQNTCFMTIEYTKDSAGTNPGELELILVDVFERRLYAAFNTTLKKQSGARMSSIRCELHPRRGKAHDCHSRVEYDEFVSSYME
jgi:hypothetical protein